MFEVPKPLSSLGVGVDQIPERIRLSKVLTGNDLGMLGNIEKIPSEAEVKSFINDNQEIQTLIKGGNTHEIHKKAQEYLENNQVVSALKILLAK